MINDALENTRPDSESISRELSETQRYDTIENAQSNSATPLASPDLNRRNRAKIDFEQVSECSARLKLQFSNPIFAPVNIINQGEHSSSGRYLLAEIFLHETN